jgi:putative ABC transport system ATP-binding protein
MPATSKATQSDAAAHVAEVINANKSFKSGDQTIMALQSTNLVVNKGDLLLIIGPSGSGKTTLLSLLGCVIYPTEGKVLINGVDTTKLNDKQMAALRLDQIGFVFQNFNLIAPLTAEQNVMLPLQLQGKKGAEVDERVDAALKLMGMSHRKKSMSKSLSGGEQQRIAIARALVTQPALMLCDEPTASLDAKSAKTVMEELRAIADAGRALAVVTHDPRLRPYATRVITVENGVAREVSPDEDLGGH